MRTLSMADLLAEGRDVIESVGWCQDSFYEEAHEDSLEVKEGAVCLVGSLELADGTVMSGELFQERLSRNKKARDAFVQALMKRDFIDEEDLLNLADTSGEVDPAVVIVDALISFNDDPRTTREDVLALMKEVEEILRSAFSRKKEVVEENPYLSLEVKEATQDVQVVAIRCG